MQYFQSNYKGELSSQSYVCLDLLLTRCAAHLAARFASRFALTTYQSPQLLSKQRHLLSCTWCLNLAQVVIKHLLLEVAVAQLNGSDRLRITFQPAKPITVDLLSFSPHISLDSGVPSDVSNCTFEGDTLEIRRHGERGQGGMVHCLVGFGIAPATYGDLPQQRGIRWAKTLQEGIQRSGVFEDKMITAVQHRGCFLVDLLVQQKDFGSESVQCRSLLLFLFLVGMMCPPVTTTPPAHRATVVSPVPGIDVGRYWLTFHAAPIGLHLRNKIYAVVIGKGVLVDEVSQFGWKREEWEDLVLRQRPWSSLDSLIFYQFLYLMALCSLSYLCDDLR